MKLSKEMEKCLIAEQNLNKALRPWIISMHEKMAKDLEEKY
jgi:hypothetical protein